MPTLILYTTAGCHLCEQALAIIEPITAQLHWQVSQVDIADSDELVDRYGIRIPVIARQDTEAEIGWPFTAEQVAELLA